MHLAIEIMTIYAVYGFGMTIIIHRYGRKERAQFIVAAWLVPFIVVVSVFHAMFLLVFRESPRVRPCPTGLDEAERIVERHRREMFGGAPKEARFAADWARLYAMTVEAETEQVQRIARRVLSFA